MIVTLSDTRMLGLWRSGAGLEPALSDASVERFDAYDTDTALRQAMRSWYLGLLEAAPLNLVPVTDISSRCTVAQMAEGLWTVTLPASVARVVSVDIAGAGSVAVVDPDNPDVRPLLTRLANRFVRRGRVPLVTYRRGMRRLLVYSADRPGLTAVMAVDVPEDDTYIIDESALGLIPGAAMQFMNQKLS